MKKFKVMLSVLMVLIIICVSVVPVLATNTKSKNQVVIREDLAAVMKNSDADDKIKVYIWYKDIDQDEVDVLTTKATGLTPESCAVITEFPSLQLLSSLEKDEPDAKKQMDIYMQRTKADRAKERENTEKYAKKHIEIANEKYRTKSKYIRESISLNEADTVFSSEFAPMIIAEMTKDELKEAVDNPNIEEINLYYEIINEEPAENLRYLDNGEYAKDSIGLSNVYDIYGLTGDGVDVGLIEAFVPGLWTDISVDFGIEYDDITVIENPYYSIVPSKTTQADEHWHSNNTFRVMAHSNYGIAPNINKYATNCELANIEAMLTHSSVENENIIDVIEYNNATLVFEKGRYPYDDPTSDNGYNMSYAYDDLEKYIDHIVSAHRITIVVAGGNRGDHLNDYFDGNKGWLPGARLTAPGLAYNAITVGAYDNNNDEERNDSNDILFSYSSWKNSYNGLYGCEKPDVIMPANFYAGGTSESSPALTATIALMLELKPSLSLYPEAVKAIVLASCHRKVKMPNESETAETMQGGITEKQGAGAPDAWTMACIVCQGTYGIGVLNGSGTTINFEQPPYGAENMNVSVTWIKENTHSINEETNEPECDDSSDITEAPYYNIDLGVLHSGELVTSTLFYSSTEMCYLPLDDTNFKYQIQLTNSSSSIASIRYGYAWSTDNMRAASVDQDGIFYIKNRSNGKYITYINTTGTPKAEIRSAGNPSVFTANHQWIIRQSGDKYNVIPANASTKLYLDQSTTQNGSSLVSQLNTVAQAVNIIYNNDGTVSFVNATNDRILTYSASTLVWNAYSGTTQSISYNQKWLLEKVNYLKGDVNADGVISETTVIGSGESEQEVNPEVEALQYYLACFEPWTNLNMFLADVDGDGVASVMDITKLFYIAESKYNY